MNPCGRPAALGNLLDATKQRYRCRQMASEDNKRLQLLRDGYQQFSPLHRLKVLLTTRKGSPGA